MNHCKLTMEGEEFILVVVPGLEQPLSAGSSHPNFEAILDAVERDDEEGIEELFDVGKAVAARFERLSDRIAVVGGTVTLDGDPVDNSLTKQILRFMDEGNEDWKPLVEFFEKVQANPDEHSREQLYVWVSKQDITITDEGDLVCYKGCNRRADGGLESGWQGKAIVNGVQVEGHIPNDIGAIIEMPRSQVRNDPNTHCSVGLHVGSFSYAKGYANGGMLEVHVNPRDFVSVPGDGAGEKSRVCRYRVVQEISAPHSTSIAPSWASRTGEDDLGYDEDGFDARGYDREGYDEDGYDEDGYDEDGYDEYGFDREGYNRDGYHMDEL